MTLEDEIAKLRAAIERLQRELAAYKKAMPDWKYSPKGDCLYALPDAMDRGDEW